MPFSPPTLISSAITRENCKKIGNLNFSSIRAHVNLMMSAPGGFPLNHLCDN